MLGFKAIVSLPTHGSRTFPLSSGLSLEGSICPYSIEQPAPPFTRAALRLRRTGLPGDSMSPATPPNCSKDGRTHTQGGLPEAVNELRVPESPNHSVKRESQRHLLFSRPLWCYLACHYQASTKSRMSSYLCHFYRNKYNCPKYWGLIISIFFFKEYWQLYMFSNYKQLDYRENPKE